MRSVARALLFLHVTLLALCASARAAGWMDLFDGKTTDGWTPRSKVESFEAKDGELQLYSARRTCWVTTDGSGWPISKSSWR